jgi:hypothetical protein
MYEVVAKLLVIFYQVGQCRWVQWLFCWSLECCDSDCTVLWVRWYAVW